MKTNKTPGFTNDWFDKGVSREDIIKQINTYKPTEYKKIAGGGRSIRVLNKSKSTVLLNGLFRVSNGHTSYINIGENEDLITTNGLTFRWAGENSILMKEIQDDLLSQNLIRVSNNNKAQIVIIGGKSNFGHFIFEFYQKAVRALITYGPEAILLVNEVCSRWEFFIHEFCQALYGKKAKIKYIPQKGNLEIRDPIFIESSWGSGSDVFTCFDTWQRSRNIIQQKYENVNTNLKLYLARSQKKGSWRDMTNRDEITRLFKNMGYEIISMGEIEKEKQLQLLANASHVAIEAGADSMASSFCKKGTKILELQLEYHLNCFGSICCAEALGHNYSRINGTMANENRGTLKIDNDFQVNADEVSRWLELNH